MTLYHKEYLEANSASPSLMLLKVYREAQEIQSSKASCDKNNISFQTTCSENEEIVLRVTSLVEKYLKERAQCS